MVGLAKLTRKRVREMWQAKVAANQAFSPSFLPSPPLYQNFVLQHQEQVHFAMVFLISASASSLLPSSYIFSHFTSCAAPSMSVLTRSTSPFPMRSAFDTSQVPPVEALSTPPVPRACKAMAPQSAFQSSRAETFSNLTMVPARRPVPKLDGQVKIQPRCSLCMKSDPSAFNTFCTSSHARMNRAVTSLMFLPSSVGFSRLPCIETMRR